jgi:hypothetical protein
MKKARSRIYQDFISFVRPEPESTILDVGVSDIQSDGANFLELQYPYKDKISACGLGEATEFKATFPQVRYTRVEPNRPLPYENDQFDIATSNAVLEHVGSERTQRQFISELARVAGRTYITVPNRYFPVEHHTAIPFLHFTDSTFRVACRLLGKEKWTEAENLILMTATRLKHLSPPGSLIGVTGLWLGPFSSNLYLFIDRQSRGSAG